MYIEIEQKRNEHVSNPFRPALWPSGPDGMPLSPYAFPVVKSASVIAWCIDFHSQLRCREDGVCGKWIFGLLDVAMC